MDELSALQDLGLELPGPAYIFGVIVFGVLGIVANRRGYKAGRPATRWLGLALMLFPYAVSRTWLLYLVGAVLCAGIYFDSR